MKMCIICHENEAVVPDRESSTIKENRICGKCHGARLLGDLKKIVVGHLALKRKFGGVENGSNS